LGSLDVLVTSVLQGVSLQREVVDQMKHDLKTRPWQSFKENFQIVREEIKKFDGEVCGL
jgi:hypothetical protein